MPSFESPRASTATTTAVFIIYVGFKKASATAEPPRTTSTLAGKKGVSYSGGISDMPSARDKSGTKEKFMTETRLSNILGFK